MFAAAAICAMGLGFVAGYADATSYLHWHAFGANMTGNTVLFGIGLVARRPAFITLVPIGAFFCGAMVANALLISATAAAALVVEAGLLVAAAFAEGYVPQLGLLALAMGVQNTAVAQFAGVRANTGFITGDYTRIAAALTRIVLGRASTDDRRTLTVVAPLIVSYAAGALIATIARTSRPVRCFLSSSRPRASLRRAPQSPGYARR